MNWMNLPLSILLVEDSLDDAELLAIELERNGYHPIYRRVDTTKTVQDNLASSTLNLNVSSPNDREYWLLTHVPRLDLAMEYLSCDRFDAVLLDLSLPDSFGLDTLKKLQAFAPDIPVVVLTGADNRELSLQAMAAGAQDYLVKDRISAQLLERSIRYAIERKKAEIHVIRALEQERELQQLKLIHSDKLASLGQLVASVAHEISNPVNFIVANLTHVDNYTQDLLDLIDLCQRASTPNDPKIQDKIEEIDLDFLKEDLPKMLNSMQIGAQRLGELVLTLRNFSRLDAAEMKPVNIHEGLDSTLLILRDRLKEKSGYAAIEVIKDYGNLPLVECYAGQLNQVFMNLLSNAIDAVHQQNSDRADNANKNSRPTITIRTQPLESNRVRISIKDNGLGMSESVQAKIFDPFFT
ncbi:MAG TPA: response regulator, partial [Allocoleopsis sp.]